MLSKRKSGKPQESRREKRNRQEYICEALWKHSHGWYGDSSCEFLLLLSLLKTMHLLFSLILNLSSCLLVNLWISSFNLVIFFFFGSVWTAREEKPRFNTNGLGQVSCFSFNRAGRLLHIRLWIFINVFFVLIQFVCVHFFQVTLISSLSIPKTDLRVIYGILTAVIGYCVKTYFALSVLFIFFSLLFLLLRVVSVCIYLFKFSQIKE